MPLQVPVVETGLEASIHAAAKKAGRSMKINMGPGAKSIDGLAQPLGRITGKADQFTKSMEAANARVLAFGASVGVLSAVTKGFKDLITTTIEVEKSLASINSILGATGGQLEQFKKTIFSVARDTEQSFSVVADAALELSRQGLKTEEVVARLNDALILSRLSGLGAAEAVAGLTAAINSFNKEGVTSSEVLNKLSAAAISAAVSERDLIEGIKRSGSVAIQAGVTLNELVGVITAVQQKTARGGAVIGNSFKTIFTRLQSLEKLETMQALGVQVTDASGAVLSATGLIENLAKTLASLPDARKLQIAENLVGKFQIAPFLAILDDYSSKTSTAIEITKVAANATNQAYTRNVALNQTLSASINEATVNLKELATTLGEIGVTDSLRNVLGFFNSMVEGIQKVLEGDGIGSKFAKGLVKGIGSVLSGPGLAIAGAIIAKLTLDLVKFGTGSLKTFFGLNQRAKELAATQGQLAATLLNNKNVQEQILLIENSQLTAEQKKVAQTKFFTTALNEQLAVMTRMQTIAATVAPGVIAGTRGGGRGRAAGGYIPNFDAVSGYGSEMGDIKRGVGGAPRSAKPVVIPNFAFGGGQKGTMVANSSEYVVPNFAGGGSAIFNQNMIGSMGLPAGARKVGAAQGYIPNFAEKKVRSGSGIQGGSKNNPITDPDFAMIVPRMNYNANEVGQAKKGSGMYYKFPVVGYQKEGVKLDEESEIKEDVRRNGLRLARSLALTMTDGEPLAAKEKKMALGNEGAVGGLAGTIFETAVSALVKSPEFDQGQTATFDFVGAKDVNDVGKLFPGVKGKSFAEAKIRPGSSDHQNSMAWKMERFGAGLSSKTGKKLGLSPFAGKQLLASRNEQIMTTNEARAQRGLSKLPLSDFPGVQRLINDRTLRKGKAASGYIPNFATTGALESAIGREQSAGVPTNQIRINQSGRLRTGGNPLGLAVTNTRDEPTGAIPNFALTMGDIGINASKPVEASLKELNVLLKRLSGEVKSGALSFDGAEREVKQFTRTIKTNGAAQKKVVAASMNHLRQEQEVGGQTIKQSRDYLGVIFGVQAGLSALSGAFGDAESATGKYISIITSGLSQATSFVFAGSALTSMANSMQGAMGGVVKGLGLLGGAVGVGYALFQTLNEINDESIGVNRLVDESMARVADGADKAAFKLSNLGELEQLESRELARGRINRFMEFDTGNALAESKNFFGDIQASGITQRRKFEGTDEKTLAALETVMAEADAAGVGLQALQKVFDKNLPKFRMNRGRFTAGKSVGVETTRQIIKDISRLRERTGGAAEFLKGKSRQELAPFEFPRGFFGGRENPQGLQGKGIFNKQEAMTMAILEGKIKQELAKKFSITDEDEVQKLVRARLDDINEAAKEQAKAVKEEGDRLSKALLSIDIADAIEGLRRKLLEKTPAAAKLKLEEERGVFDTEALGELKERADIEKRNNASVLQTAESYAKMIALSKNLTATENARDIVVEKIKNLSFENLETEEQRVAVMKEMLKDLGMEDALATKNAAHINKSLKLGHKKLETERLISKELIRQELLREKAINIQSLAGKEANELGKKLPQLDFGAVRPSNFFDRARGGVAASGAREMIVELEKAMETRDFTGVHQLERAQQMKNTLISASETFAGNMAKALTDSIAKGENLGDALRNAATSFLNTLSEAYFNKAIQEMLGAGGKSGDNLFNRVIGFMGNQGGMVTGGSGNRDDVPALLTGGEFVMKRKAVEKYGAHFMRSLNAGVVPAMQRGGLFTPGTYGQGAITGKENLLDFATQGATTGAHDQIAFGATAASVNLEPQSKRLSAFGRRNNPRFQREQQSKREAFGLYVQQIGKEAQIEKQNEESKKAFERALLAAAIGATVSKGASTLFGKKPPINQNPNLTGSGRSASDLPPGLSPQTQSFPSLRKSADPYYNLPEGQYGIYRAAGGYVPNAAGVDTVPTMLSGGEFVMNAGAAQRIGAGNLNALNGGAATGGGGGSDERIVGKLDELNETIASTNTEINITVNSEGGETSEGGQAPERQQRIAGRIKDVVRQVIDEEKRLGGSLRQR
jgi:TP901 family phage tail tape measure protein